MPWRKGNKLKLLQEGQAEGHMAEIYREIKDALGVPHVNVIFQAYGVYPEFLARFWEAAAPMVRSREFFEMADRIGAEAYTRMHNYFVIPSLCEDVADRGLGVEARRQLTYTADLYHYNNPLLLLLAAAQMQAFEGPVGRHGRPHPADHPVFTEKPELIEEEQAPTAVRRIYEDIRRVFALPMVNSDYRAFARWPEFLQTYWRVLKPIAQSPIYQESHQGIRESAWTLARELPVTLDLSASRLLDEGMSDDQVSDLFRMTDLFVRDLSGLVLNVAVAKIGLEGGSGKLRPEQAA